MTVGASITLLSTEHGSGVMLGRHCRAFPELDGDGMETQHAQIHLRDGAWLVRDLGSAAGTRLNGREVYGSQPVVDGDVLTLGHTDVRLRFSSQIDSCGAQGNVSSVGCTVLEIDDLSVSVPGRVLLEGVSISALAGEFIGILGPSGCGKSTLIKAIAGLAPATSGTITISRDGNRISTASSSSEVAYLPQEVLIHEQLRVQEALFYIAALKALAGQPPTESVEDALSKVGLGDRLATPISALSGGQKKRVGLAAELLGNPRIVLLDEATSGLDPAAEADLMELFRELAASGKTVLCVTHNPSRLALCHRLLFIAAGRLLFDGTPDGLVNAMQVRTLDDVYRKASRTPIESLVNNLPATAQAVIVHGGRRRTDEVVAAAPEADRGVGVLWGQLKLLVSRYRQLALGDWKNLALLIGQAPVIALLVVLTFGSIRADFAELHAARLKEVFLILVLAVLWCSGTASIREIVKEWPILRHERRYGVLPGAVLLSKFILLGIIAVIQAGLLTGIVKMGCGVVGAWIPQLCVLSLLACIGVMQGLCISAIAGTSERAMTILPVLLIGEAIISGGFGHLTGLMRAVALTINPAFWALDGLRTTLGTELLLATYPGAPGSFQPCILGMSGPLWLDVAILALQGCCLFTATFVFLSAGFAARWANGAFAGIATVTAALSRFVTPGEHASKQPG